jgi:hypothetical protein
MDREAHRQQTLGLVILVLLILLAIVLRRVWSGR